MLYAVSAITVAALKLGAPPLAVTSALVAAFGRVGLDVFEIELVDRAVEATIRVLDEASSRELRAWLKLLRDDQGGIVQLMPEAMDLFQAGVEDRPGVRYQCVATFAPPPGVTGWLGALRSPWGALSATIFALFYNITAREDDRYPCAPSDGSAQRKVRALLGEVPPRRRATASCRSTRRSTASCSGWAAPTTWTWWATSPAPAATRTGCRADRGSRARAST